MGHNKRTPLFYLLSVFMAHVLLSCSSYQKPISLEKAVARESGSGHVKVTLLNGDQFVFESLIYSEQQYYGQYFDGKDLVKVVLDAGQIATVQIKKEQQARGSTLLGGSIAFFALLSAVLML